jgi:hypothetical protein
MSRRASNFFQGVGGGSLQSVRASPPAALKWSVKKSTLHEVQHLNGVKMSLDFGAVNEYAQDTMISSQEPAKEKRDNDD